MDLSTQSDRKELKLGAGIEPVWKTRSWPASQEQKFQRSAAIGFWEKSRRTDSLDVIAFYHPSVTIHHDRALDFVLLFHLMASTLLLRFILVCTLTYRTRERMHVILLLSFSLYLCNLMELSPL